MSRPALPRLLALLLGCLLLAAPAAAQQRPAFGLAPPGAQQEAPAPGPGRAVEKRPAAGGVLGRAWLWIVEGQRELTAGMTAAVRQLERGPVAASTAILAAISFLYGVLHAIGPGHGKFVISSYALASERTVRRGILLSFMAALVQALSAVVIVAVLALLLRATSLQIRVAEAWLESASWGLVALIGAWLLAGQLRSLPRPAHTGSAAGGGHHDDHGGGAAEARHHAHAHAHDGHCGHAHIATPEQLAGPWSWARAWSLALSVGIRPCTGAIAVLLFALGIGLFWAGVLAAFVMALGTAVTVSALVAAAVGSRELAARLAGGTSRAAVRVRRAAGVAGSGLVMLMGLVFLAASLTGPAPV